MTIVRFLFRPLSLVLTATASLIAVVAAVLLVLAGILSYFSTTDGDTP
jgi:hypothetical protein